MDASRPSEKLWHTGHRARRGRVFRSVEVQTLRERGEARRHAREVALSRPHSINVHFVFQFFYYFVKYGWQIIIKVYLFIDHFIVKSFHIPPVNHLKYDRE